MTTSGRRRAEADDEYTEYVRSRMVQWRRTAYLMCGDWDRGDDILQRVLTELYRSWAPTDRITVVGALRQVPPRQRAVLVLRYFQDLSVEETARAMGCSTGTVKSQTAKGLATLRTLLTPTLTGN